MKTFSSLEMTSVPLRQGIEKLIEDCALPEGSLNWRASEISELEQIFLSMGLESYNPVRKLLYPAYVKWIESGEEKKVVTSIQELMRAA